MSEQHQQTPQPQTPPPAQGPAWTGYLGWAGNGFSIFFFLSPFIQFSALIKGKVSIDVIPGVQLILNYMNCIIWVCYAVRKGLLPNAVCNIIGCSINIFWILIFLVFLGEKKCFKSIVYIFLFLDIAFQIFYIFFKIIPDIETVGYTAMIFNILMYAGPLEKLGTVCKTGNYTLIPILSVVLTICNSCCWTIFGLGVKNPQTYIPNIIGIGLGIIEIILWFYFKGKYKPGKKDEKGEPLKEVEE